MAASIEQVSSKTFDYVVIGGGTAGLVVASRLSEDPDISVLVLEAGPANLQDPAILTPASFGSHFMKPQYDWAFSTVAQKNAKDREFYWPRGKGLGGSSAINFFQYHLPAKSDIDAFEELGNAGWNWDLLKKYYKKSERFIPPKVTIEAMNYRLEDHGTDGPLHVGYPVTLSGLEGPYQEALRSLGIPHVEEPFSGNTNGTWLTPVTIHPIERVRSYSANMYYEPNSPRVNLTVLASALVTKIIVRKDLSGVSIATAVEFLHEEATCQVRVGKEVVLSAGAIKSPQILELSGIGNEDVLQRAEIEGTVNVPGVGNNVQEHVYSGASYEIRDDRAAEFLTFDCLRDPDEAVKQLELYKSGQGVFGMSSICMTFVPLSSISQDYQALQRELTQSIESGIREGKFSPALQKQFSIQLEHIKLQEPSCEIVLTQTFSSKPKLPEPNKKYITLSSLINHPFSRGTIHVKSSDPKDDPEIDPHYFEEQYDIRTFVELLKFNRRLAQQEPLKSILSGKEVNPGPEYETDEQIADFLKTNCSTTFHTIGSCSMLPFEDGGVVYNTVNIRVVDLSVLPLHIGAHMQATAYAIGELGADIIKGVV
ncbi:GMC oxidoreductase [Auriscalpium vulgare]|uniref:GMC oxidoreductase n=1 Tax=Auriscalpium vulgare TaxID=40419 RepID=A0ACB8RHV5_9AGAM|nr:GMC oxidoreductase [Auriscalpium vulgare]